MGRRPCCEKTGLKKGPWSAEEDPILIRLHGHPNWRALPKLAGLLRCRKSCRLRWINYLRPDIKRGNFTQVEETIINLHQILGNRWSAIAAKLPGRTDNDIKNVWHTHLKERLNQNQDQNSSEIFVSITTEVSAVTTSGNNKDISNNKDSATSSEDVLAFIDERFWSEVVSMDCNFSGDEKSEKRIEDWERSLDGNDKGYNYSKLYNMTWSFALNFS